MSSVLPKCGSIVAWHWAHLASGDCDPWAEPDSTWHRGWQAIVPAHRREVVLGGHRADIVTADGTVVELQRSAIDPAAIRSRERHYRNMVWVFDAVEAYQSGRLTYRQVEGKGYYTFRWKQPRKSLKACARPVLLDLPGDEMFRLKRIHTDRPCRGWGYPVSREHFVAWLTREAA